MCTNVSCQQCNALQYTVHHTVYLPHTLPRCVCTVYTSHTTQEYVADYGRFLASKGEKPVTVQRFETVEEVLKTADVCWLCVGGIC